MNRYAKIVIGLVTLVILLGGSVALYNNLSKQYKVDNNLTKNQDKNTEESTNKPETESQKTEEPEENDQQEKAAALDFTVVDRDNQEKTLLSFKGKPVILNFWASWCGPCKKEFPDFQKAYEQYGQDIEFVMVNLTDGSRETKESAESYIKSENYTLPIYFDIKGDAANTYAIYSIPTTYFIDKDGYIVASAQGMIQADTLQTGIDMIK